MTSESKSEIPSVVARLSSDGIHLVVESCPHCQKRHKHGAGRDPKNPLYGHRVGHCDKDIEQPGYILVPPGTPAKPPRPEYLLQFFLYEGLPARLATAARPFCELAHAIANGDNDPQAGNVTFGGPLPRNPERIVALRELLAAKDAALRALMLP
jgi:hypothetical protein